MPESSQSPEQIALAAVAAFEKGELDVAAKRIGRALFHDPQRREWLALLSQIVEAAPDPLELVPARSEGLSIGSIAVRAYAKFKTRKYHDAIELILKAAVSAPQTPYLDWALAWLKRPDAANTLNCVKLTDRFKSLLEEMPSIREGADGGTNLLLRLPQLISRIRETQICDVEFLLTAADILRGVPDLAGAYAAAREAHDIEPSRASCLALAGVYRDQGDPDRAGMWYQSALEHDPDDVEIRNSLGDMLWEAKRLDEAEHWYRAALETAPENMWASPSYLAVRYERTGDEDAKDKLDAYVDAYPGNARARMLADRFGPYFGTWLPEPAEASLGLVRMMVEKWHAGADVNVSGISLSWLEAPSVYLAYKLELAHEGKRGQLTINVGAVPRPDVRLPRVPVNYQVWRYNGTKPMPALTEPPERTKDAIAFIAASPYNLKNWFQKAAEIGAQFGPGRAREVMAVMVHPPVMPDGFWPWTWVQHVQIAAALILAKLETGWKGSVRRQVLYDLANGPLDWTTNAAILALAMVADTEPRVVEEVASFFNELLREAPQGGYICHLHTLVSAYQRLPNLSPRERGELVQWRRRLERG